MGSVGKSVSKSSVSDLVGKLDKYDKRYSEAIIRAAEAFHKEFPEFPELAGIMLNENLEGLAGMNGVGILSLNPKYLNDYDAVMEDVRSSVKKGWLAGDVDYANNVVSHELGHNLDKKFDTFMTQRAPDKFTTESVDNEVWAKAYSEIFGREVKVGDTIQDQSYDGSAIMFKLDGVGYSVNDISYRANGLSSIVVPKAISNIQDNWQKFGFKSRPTERELVSNLSGYANSHGVSGSESYHTEVFAEAYANYRSYGSNSNILAQEIMRMTKSAYRQVASKPKNTYQEYLNRTVKAFSKAMK